MATVKQLSDIQRGDLKAWSNDLLAIFATHPAFREAVRAEQERRKVGGKISVAVEGM